MVMDLGAYTPFLWWLREREIINDFMEELCGARLTYNYMRVGGVAADLPPGFDRKVVRWLNHFEPMIDEFNGSGSQCDQLGSRCHGGTQRGEVADGEHSVRDMQSEYAQRFGLLVMSDEIQTLVDQLDRALFLDSPRFQEAKERALKFYRKLRVRPGFHAGKRSA